MTDQRPAVQVTCLFHVDSPLNTEEFHAHGERVMDALIDLEECSSDLSDSDVGTDSATRTIRIGVLVYGEDQDAAGQRAIDLIRTAIHTAGGSTPDWPLFRDLPQVAAEVEYHRPKVTMEPALV